MTKKVVRVAAMFLMQAALVCFSNEAKASPKPKEVEKGSPNHKKRQARPIQLGVSGGTTIQLSSVGCCSGTLGSLVKDASGTFYILSNSHVFAGDYTPGNNGKISTIGDPINQPGFIDIKCQNISNDYVAKLSGWSEQVAGGVSEMDAAIAEVMPGMVDETGKILEIGTISRLPIEAAVGQKVKKSGRTSGLTHGRIHALHVSVNVQYTDECGGAPFTTTYHDQILITPGSFLQGGDSGSLLVEDVDTNPRPVGLLFAGSSSVAIATAIQPVLDHFSVEMVGVDLPVQTQRRFRATAALLAPVAALKKLHAERLMQVEGAVGHAVGFSQTDGLKAVVFLLVDKTTENTIAQAPTHLDGVPVEILEVGTIKAY